MRPRKRFGQHFLEPVWASKLVDALSARPADTFLEIGPGSGALTKPLADTGARILAVEIDRDLAARLAREVPGNVTVIAGDFLHVDVLPILLGLMPQRPAVRGGTDAPASLVRVVGNLPYNVSSPILFRLLALQNERAIFSDATLMLQREVASRIVAVPGTRDFGPLSIFTQLQADATRLLDLPPGAFRPMPKVDSTVIRLVFRPTAVSIPDPALFETMVRRMFTGRRKTVLNAIRPFAVSVGTSAEAGLAMAGVSPTRRPDTLQLTELARLAAFFTSARKRSVL